METIIERVPIVTLIKRNCIICYREIMVDITHKEVEDREKEAIHAKCIRWFDGARQELHDLKKV